MLGRDVSHMSPHRELITQRNLSVRRRGGHHGEAESNKISVSSVPPWWIPPNGYRNFQIALERKGCATGAPFAFPRTV